MANIAVEKIKGNEPQSQSLTSKLDAMAERIRRRAFEISEHRGGMGQPVEDWLQAERDLVRIPESELVEKNGKYEIQVAVPGFRASETKVTALPDTLIVSAESSHKHEEHNASVHFCEFGSKALYRRLDLPAPINVDKVTASLDDGMLRITAQKSEAAATTGRVAA